MRLKQLHLRDYAPAITGLLLILVGMWLPLGTFGAPRLIDLVSYWASVIF
ncbi:MAG: hypothetical protein ACXVP2_02020 [Tumebacillaceae bacterium]